jgi:beta-mannosidase
VKTIHLNGSDWQFKGFIGEDWLMRKSHLPETRDQRGWRSAVVPGSVQHDLWQSGQIPDPYRAMNSLAAEWASDRTWVYKKRFTAGEDLRGKQVWLVFHGVDYAARYFINGEALGQSEGMFLPVRFDVSERLNYGGENHLSVVIEPAPFEQPQIGYTSKVYTQKARMVYWWDFCPRIVHLGIWQGVELQVNGALLITDICVRTDLAADFSRAEVQVLAEISGTAAGKLEVSVYPEADPQQVQRHTAVMGPGQPEVKTVFSIDQPELWWPNGAGAQPLYRADLRIVTNEGLSDEQSVTFGIRKIEFVANESAPVEALPYTLTINGRKIYLNGWNWVPMDVLYGVEQPEKRERLLRLARNAHVNMLRVWGGGLIEQEAFYNLCDRLGILVWQEFIQSSSGVDNVPSEDPAFIEFLIQNAEAAIRGRRNHAALAAWCGGNELHYAQDRLCDDSHPALAALLNKVQQLDPARQWFPTSPSGGLFGFRIPESPETGARLHDVHGPWEYQGLQGQYRLYNQGQSMLHSEFGVEGLTNLPALDAVIPTEQQWPVSLHNPAWEHLGSWWVKETVWAEAWGTLPDVTAVQRATQFLQADGLRYAVEADRRRQYHNSGTLPWQFNEPYPMAACTSAVDYFAEPKPVYYTVGRAYRPLTVTARFDTLAWGGSETFSASIWCSNAEAAQAAELSLRILGPGGELYHAAQMAVEIPENASQELHQFTLPMAAITAPYFILDLALRDVTGQQVAENRYLFCTGENLSPLLSAAPANITAAVEKSGDEWQLTLENDSDSTALGVWLSALKPDLRAKDYAYFQDNYINLLPGERRSVQVQWSGGQASRVIKVAGWNFEAKYVGQQPTGA